MEPSKKEPSLYLIHYRDPATNENQSLKAKKVYDSPLGLSFVCISDFVFETSGLVVKPSEEQLQKRLEDVKRLHLSIYSIISIEEIGQTNKGLKFADNKSKILVLPQDNNNLPPPQ